MTETHETSTPQCATPPRPLISQMDASMRPREKALRQGLEALEDAELLALLLGTGVRGQSVVEMGRGMLADHGGHLHALARMSVSQMARRYRGMGPAKALVIKAALELGRRAELDRRTSDPDPIRTSRDAYEQVQDMAALDHEEFVVLLLSRANKVVQRLTVSRGGWTSTVVDVRVIVRAALEVVASGMVLAHNHPSGAVMPSAEDDKVTRRVVDAARVFDMRVLDHIIVGHGQYYSYLDQGKL